MAGGPGFRGSASRTVQMMELSSRQAPTPRHRVKDARHGETERETTVLPEIPIDVDTNATMNPEDDGAALKQAAVCRRGVPAKPPKFQSKLKQKISESKLLQIVDVDASNQQDDDELVCESTMISVDVKEDQGFDRRGVLHTIRSMHKQQQHASKAAT
ncbi:hypothetical protein H310_08013 [Aphanomyces invadans]|uniref:Uncharacterized protein n=1 Tax=Aphanomyces invadans TaxID=157072 RepID=A0A024TZ30_9STRA|nr:hypothetical protein H310_08013 [Aphanomyces invadans]ETV99273.1 hypothetical protein H310_08013 [Aphanomyces invadans]|eukprot:XP_008871829.1 hypothetical protein H310_08013 [Aphanomyces invadans]